MPVIPQPEQGCAYAAHNVHASPLVAPLTDNFTTRAALQSASALLHGRVSSRRNATHPAYCTRPLRIKEEHLRTPRPSVYVCDVVSAIKTLVRIA